MNRKGKTYVEIYGIERAILEIEKRKKKSNKKGHTYEQIYGKNKAQEIKERNQLKSLKGKRKDKNGT